MHSTIVTLAVLLTAPLAVAQQGGDTTRFDGNWNVNINCAQTRDAQGYAIQVPAQVTNGELKGTTGTKGGGDSHNISGRIAPDGSARFQVNGIAGAAKYLTGGAAAGTPYRYTAVGKFEAARGSAERVELRPCSLFFTKR
jgi:hypothetical protein